MKIAYVVETYTEGLGYIDNLLPLELSKIGNDVHLITCCLPPYYQVSAAHFGSLLTDKYLPGDNQSENFTMHICEYSKVGSRILIKNLLSTLRLVKPDVVIVRGVASPVLGQVILAKLCLGFDIYTSTGQAYSALPLELREGRWFSRARLRNFFSRVIIGWVFSKFVRKCIGSTLDCADAVVDFYGYPKDKTTVISLGVDTDRFFPANTDELTHAREVLRKSLGFSNNEIVCIWTGRMTQEKAIEVLACAVEELRADGYLFSALFIGSGSEAHKLHKYNYSKVLEFMPWSELPAFYRASDVAVWPRSITTSTLDASASGLPVIMSDKELATERWQGIGSTYIEGDVSSLKQVLLSYIDKSKRDDIGRSAAQQMKVKYSWNAVALAFERLIGSGGRD